MPCQDPASPPRTRWRPVVDAWALPVGSIVPFEIDGEWWVVWRTHSGALGTMPRRCPHLDWDLLEAGVVGEYLVCTGHGWCFDTAGRAGKRNVLGRLDRKDDVGVLPVREHDGRVEVAIAVAEGET
jgi:nitrite reductase/ring-hydroxylating ferredoxin subunit